MCVLTLCMHEVFLTVDLQHGRGLRLPHAVLRCAGIRSFILLFHPEQTQVVAVPDFKPGEGRKTDNERPERAGCFK